jgi:hypothetical protein
MLVGEASFGPSFTWVKTPDMPFVPGQWEEHTHFLFRAAGSVQYRFQGGFLVACQPIGLLAPLDGGQAGLEVALTVGYQAS